MDDYVLPAISHSDKMADVSTSTETAPRFVGPMHDNLNSSSNNDSYSNAQIVAYVHDIAYTYVANIIVGIGIIGNLLNLIVLTRPKLKGVMYVYLLALAVSNLCVLFTSIPAVMSLATPAECTASYSTAFFHAHLMMPLLNSFMASSVYIIICMTVNRYISIYMPTYFQRIHTFKNAYLAIACSFLGGVWLHVPLCFEAEPVPCKTPPTAAVDVDDETWIETYDVAEKSEVKQDGLYKVYVWISETLLRLAPIITLTILNMLIIVRYNRIARKRLVLKGTPAVHRDSNGGTNGIAGHPPTPMTYSNGCHSTPGHSKLLTIPANESGNGATSTSVEHVHFPVPSSEATSAIDVDQRATPSAGHKIVDTVTVNLNGSHYLVHSSTTSLRQSSLHGGSHRGLSVRGTPNRVSTRRRGLHNPEERMLVVVLIAIVVLFVICTTPAAILSILYNKDRGKKVGFSVFRAIANNLELLGFSINFFVYCRCSADIRRAFVDVLFENGLVLYIRQWWHKSSTANAAAEDLDRELADVGAIPTDNVDSGPCDQQTSSVHANNIVVINNGSNSQVKHV